MEIRGGRARHVTGMSTFLQRQAKSIMDQYWQLIQVRKCDVASCGFFSHFCFGLIPRAVILDNDHSQYIYPGLLN